MRTISASKRTMEIWKYEPDGGCLTFKNSTEFEELQPEESFGASAIGISKEKAHLAAFSQDFSQIPVHPRSRVSIQAKLTVNTPGDVYEMEADRIADQVLAAPLPHAARGSSLRIQRFSVQPSQQIVAAPASVDRVLASPGRQLEPALRRDMEERFGYDFSGVRVHSGSAAEQSVRDVSAHAYTVGHHIVFDNGMYAPYAATGRRLLAHELAHVVQQSQAGLAGNPGLHLGSSLSLQRQQCSRANDRIVTDPLREEMPAVRCEPTPETLGTVRSNAAPGQEVFGVTHTITGQQQIDFQELRGRGSLCRATIRELESLSFNPFMYTRPGTYDYGIEVVPAGRPCPKGLRIPRKLRIIESMAKILRDGEIEHCNDHKLAFALSQGKYNRAIRDLEGEYCAAGRSGARICEPEFEQRFKDRTGIDFNQQSTIARCLHDKTKIRDDPTSGVGSAPEMVAPA